MTKDIQPDEEVRRDECVRMTEYCVVCGGPFPEGAFVPKSRICSEICGYLFNPKVHEVPQ